MGYNIAMISDFFYPQLGGVEFHMYHLAQELIKLGNSVIIVVHAYSPDRVGVRYLSNGLKVYYVPYFVLHRETTFPNVFGTFPWVRNILIREQIDIVHTHGSASTFSLEGLLCGNTLGLKTVFTDHSLYGFGNITSIWVNKLLTFSLTNTDKVICVSNTCKENMIMRTKVDPSKMYVIPNAVVSADFKPTESAQDKEIRHEREGCKIVTINRLFANKGADLLTHIIPIICSLHSDVEFIIAGDGPKYVDFQQMIEKNRLEDKVTLLGPVPHEKVRDVMCQGDIYLHASLTEAFGTVLVEAASCGLLIVTTTVGGIPEVLPSHMMVYADDTSVTKLVESLNKAIKILKENKYNGSKVHEEIEGMYDWSLIARRTMNVYTGIFENAKPDDKNWLTMIKKFNERDGIWAKHLYMLCGIVEYLLFLLFEILYPSKNIELAPKWPSKEVVSNRISHSKY
ncbi:hypothetical protein TPHA_0D01420 [Tetrapisispora phaffii CBS 4417]|uniref:Phosphatidylinositol N-acetylglucosaminyltransferase GPI3 subunit n=1 Tax=Tetrapisispora phaffii (strain ATCC 24235 / CBS 4417 / NBRC 1672 / NRRL Y-8282 / UCD 70-5) TaxID=1071381 RepID=G8BSG2_TETPH|nr:hypothetical protein TPHA_0D01420 [Tetrapisispora phaffii CBS 4417]CCE62783.1 hypothetical protein TPHA_0D01420 [Tetrapisispora phaffii CBS 4417]